MLFSMARGVSLFSKVVSLLPCRSNLNQYSVYSCSKRRTLNHVVISQVFPFSSEEWDYDVDKVLKDDAYDEFSDRLFRMSEHGHKVLVIQPFIKEQQNVSEEPIRKHVSNTTPELQLDEAVALINTLSNWKAEDRLLLGLFGYRRQSLFGSGQIDRIKQILGRNRNISAVFVSVNILMARQIIYLEQALKVPVYDRYTIVVQIFRQHANTSEAKLQIAMAEIPYLRQCIKGLPLGLSDRISSASFIGGMEKMYSETRKELLKDREKKLKKALSLLRNHRERLRTNIRKSSLPVVAVMGYTNAGKTSLIKALSGAEKLQPKNHLFATLDVTKHQGMLPCNLKVLFVDTVGFITDIPTELLESFTATLEDAVCSDVLIHIWDASNPDFRKQKEHVVSTLAKLNFGEDLSKKLFVIANKVDCLSEDAFLELQKSEPNTYFVSAKTGFGMEEMLSDLQNKVLHTTGRRLLKIRVRTGGEEHFWIQKEFPIKSVEPDSDSTYSLLTVVVTKNQLETFKNKFLKVK